MITGDRVHDREILDALEAIAPTKLATNVWRVTRQGRNALRGSSANGRWSPVGEFEVLYTSLERDGALSEIGFRLSLEPVWPSLIRHELHSIRVNAENILPLTNLKLLRTLGVNADNYASFDYERTQAVAAAARFLNYAGMLVPNARFDCLNFVAFNDRIPLDAFDIRASKPIDWEQWRRSRR